jgi:hypothetical protein
MGIPSGVLGVEGYFRRASIEETKNFQNTDTTYGIDLSSHLNHDDRLSDGEN